MGLFRKSRKINVEDGDQQQDEQEVVRTNVPEKPKICMVILEFPPQFGQESSDDDALRVVFRHENDSIVSDCSNCSCRIANHGRRRPDCCVACAEMRETERRRKAARQAPRQIPALPNPNDDENTKPDQGFSPNIDDHKLPTSIAVLTKIMASPSTPTTSHKQSTSEIAQHGVLAAKHRKSKSSTSWLFAGLKQTDTKSLSMRTEDLSLDHELS